MTRISVFFNGSKRLEEFTVRVSEQKRMNRAKKSKGFTLIELLIVVAILGILAAVAIPGYQNYKERSVRSACIANLNGVRKALGLYVADQVKYPLSNEINSYVDLRIIVPMTNLPVDSGSHPQKFQFISYTSVDGSDYTLIVAATDTVGTTFVVRPSTIKQQ